MTQADGEISAEMKETKRADGRLQGEMTGNSKGLANITVLLTKMIK